MTELVEKYKAGTLTDEDLKDSKRTLHQVKNYAEKDLDNDKPSSRPGGVDKMTGSSDYEGSHKERFRKKG